MAELKTIVFSPYPLGRPKQSPTPDPAVRTGPTERDRQIAERLAVEDRRLRELRRQRLLKGDVWVRTILEECELEGEPILTMRLLNQVANRFTFQSWTEKQAKKRELLRLITVMLHQGRLGRVGRRFVTIPASNQKFKEWEQVTLEPLDLPEPQL
jgi:hypothetical protein